MMTNHREANEAPQTIEQEASNTFVRRLHGEWTEQDQAALEARLESDSAYADAYRRVQESWNSLDTHADAPEVIAYREDALVYARRSNARRWLGNGSISRGRWRLATAAAGVAIALATTWQLSPYGYKPGVYRTGIGEQRLVDLEDRSRIALDAKSRLQVRYTEDARLVHLLEGQAQFSVAKDPARPFKVQVGDRTIVALGTVFIVEYVDRNMRVAMLEGRVAVYPPSSREPTSGAPDLAASSAPPDGEGDRRSGEDSFVSATHKDEDSRNRIPNRSPREILTPGPSPSDGETSVVRSKLEGEAIAIELAAGEALRVSRDGRATVIAHADLEAATAWREGKVIFRKEPLSDAVRRLNRYARLQIEIQDEALATREISGVFEAGDTRGFVSAVQRYYSVTPEYVGTDTVRLRMN